MPKPMTLRSQKSTIEEMATREEFAALSADIKSILEKQNETQDLIRSLKAEVNQLKDECKQKDVKIQFLELRVNDLEQYTRQDDIIISGLKTQHKSYARSVSNQGADSFEAAPVNETDTIENQVVHFLASKDILVDKKDISVVHALKSFNPSKPNIVMRMVSRKAKSNIMKQAKKLKGSHVFLNEHLTKQNNHLYKIARDLKKKNQIKWTYTRNCKIFVRTSGITPEEEKTLIIKDIDDLIKLGYCPDTHHVT